MNNRGPTGKVINKYRQQIHFFPDILPLQHNIKNVNNPVAVGRPVVHLDHVAPRGLAGDGDEGSVRVLGHSDLLPAPVTRGLGRR